MKLLLSVCLVGFVFLGVQAGFAQNENLMGLSVDPLSIEPCLIGPGNAIYLAHLYISRPVNYEFDGLEKRSVDWVSGFECRVWIEGDAILLDWSYPVNAIDAGTQGNTIVGFAEPVPVIDNFTVVATVQILMTYSATRPDEESGNLKMSPLPCDNPTGFVFMTPCIPRQSIEGMMAFLDADDPDNPLVGATLGGNIPEEDVAMLLEVQPVGTEAQSWGGVKALYR